MVGGITSGISSIQAATAMNAFKKAAQSTQKTDKTQDIQDIAQVSGKEIKAQDSNKVEEAITPQKKEFIEEFKRFASKYNTMGISDKDIMYALKYGGNLLVDQVG